MKNYSILEQNILHSLRHEEAKSAFMRARDQRKDDKPYSYFAERLRGKSMICAIC